ncbi:hypothetical protein CPC08DRAFT_761532 [Agrocybe pediades]|nr:hypothetical protein CPC08DRAFT_761532 [Agrocybe pediades]
MPKRRLPPATRKLAHKTFIDVVSAVGVSATCIDPKMLPDRNYLARTNLKTKNSNTAQFPSNGFSFGGIDHAAGNESTEDGSVGLRVIIHPDGMECVSSTLAVRC